MAGKTSMLSPKGILDRLGLGMILDFLTPKEGGTSLLSPEAILMLSVGVILDFLSIICGILTFVAIGAILSKIIYVIGFIIVSIWSIFRGGGIQSGQKQISKQAAKGLSKFLKNNLGNLFQKAIPIWGDFIPFWTITIFLELKKV